MNKLFTATLIAASLGATAYAQSPEGPQRFSARIEAGAAYVNTTDQLFARGDHRNDALDDSASRSEAVLPVILFDLRYRSEASGTEVFLGTPLDSASVRLTLGVGHTWKGFGTLEVAAIANPWDEVWKDPYRVGGQRDATLAQEYGGRIGLSSIAGTGLKAGYTGLHTRVADDEAGDRLPTLERSGWTHDFELGYQIPVLPGTFLVPEVAAVIGDLGGSAEASRGYEGRLSALVVRHWFTARAFVSGGHTRYREQHPLFGERRSDSSFGGGLLVTLPRLFGLQRAFANVLVSHGVRDSNLGFFDADTTMAAATLGYSL